jgi:hypothetical protein
MAGDGRVSQGAQDARLDSLCFTFRQQLGDGRCITGNHHFPRRVLPGQPDPGTIAGQAAGDVGWIGENNSHGPVHRLGGHESGAFGHQADGRFQLKYPGNDGGGIFAHALAQNDRRFDTPRLPQSGQRDLQGKEGHLSGDRVGYCLTVIVAKTGFG